MQVFFVEMEDVTFQKAEFYCLPTAGCVSVWRFGAGSGSEGILGDAERKRLGACVSPEVRRLFLDGRAGVRVVAGRCGGIPPEAVLLRSDERGKPFFDAPLGLHFNLSHSGGVAMGAFSAEPVGLDIELRGRRRDFSAIARRFFHRSESDAVLRAGGGAEDVFLRIWTAKEAIVKLSGTGLAAGLELAGTDSSGCGFFGDRAVHLRRFISGDCFGTVASFSPFEVKGWFDM